MQLVRSMEEMLLSEGLDLHLTTFQVLSVGPREVSSLVFVDVWISNDLSGR